MKTFEDQLQISSHELNRHFSLIADLNAISSNNLAIEPTIQLDYELVDILKSGFIIHLYNVIEAVMSSIIDEVAECAVRYPPNKWSEQVRIEWLRHRTGVEANLTPHTRLKRTRAVVNEAIQRVVNVDFSIVAKHNWSDQEITRLSTRLGCNLKIPAKCFHESCERKFQDNLTVMKYVRHKRNKLTHGNETFTLGAKEVSVRDLGILKQLVLEYMTSVSQSYALFLKNGEFLHLSNAA